MRLAQVLGQRAPVGMRGCLRAAARSTCTTSPRAQATRHRLCAQRGVAEELDRRAEACRRRRRSAAPPAAPACRWRSPPAAGWRGRAAASRPSPVVPSGNTATVSPACSASAIWCTTRSASRLRSRSMNSVPAPATSQPSSGQRQHVGLGDEARLRQHRVDRHDVEPRRRGWPRSSLAPGRGVPLHLQADAEHAQQLGRPPARCAAAGRPVQRREAQQPSPPCRAGRAARRARQAPGGAQQPVRDRRSAARPRRPRCRPPAWRARGRAVRCRCARRQTACACPGCAAPRASPASARSGSKTQRSATPPSTSRAGAGGERAQRIAQHPHRLAGDHRQRALQAGAAVCSPQFSARPSSSSSPVAPGSASAKGSVFSSSPTGMWSLTSASMVPSASAARSASRSRALRSGGVSRIAGVEVADVDVGQVQRVDADVGASPAGPRPWPRAAAPRRRRWTGGTGAPARR